MNKYKQIQPNIFKLSLQGIGQSDTFLQLDIYLLFSIIINIVVIAINY